ncbi:hypothetical protein B0I35DRAFT_424999 [Stachybotrys elegans]|uniref:Uncharacterized protein n=1 Tax=Stachybotrys elegans TaxID=80388 RepID=A0A8K0T363_9HYPO|nr:hypothetical protein B0I35DRAFT_424999 [Stachybotrys elegans]
MTIPIGRHLAHAADRQLRYGRYGQPIKIRLHSHSHCLGRPDELRKCNALIRSSVRKLDRDIALASSRRSRRKPLSFKWTRGPRVIRNGGLRRYRRPGCSLKN